MYRDDLAALAARQVSLTQEVADKSRELANTTQMLHEARTRARLPVLDNIKVASPCSADWNAMTGDDRARHCGSCNKTVFNLSGMSRDEAESLIVEKTGALCVRYFQRKDGTILTKDCAIGISQKRKRRLIAAGAAALLAGGGALAAFGNDTAPDDDIREVAGEPMIVQGGMAHEPIVEMGVVGPEIR
jgi:hypothetical protein